MPPKAKSVNREEIKRRREVADLSQADAAKLAGFTTGQEWSDIERGMRKDITASKLWKIARALGCAMDDLMK